MTKWIRLTLIALLVLVTATQVLAQEEIEVGDTIEGSVADEVYEYELELEEDDTVEISIEADWDTYLELYDEDGVQVAFDDDGGEGRQSRIVFVAEDDGTYTILVRAFGNDIPEGDYELSVEAIEVMPVVDGGELEYDDDEDIDVDDALAAEVTFAGEAGDVINIITFAETYQDTTLILLDPQGNELAESDNFYGDGILLRIELADSGDYTIRIEESNGGILVDEIEIEVQLTEIITLDNGEIEVEIGDNGDTTFVNFTAEDDAVYELTMLFDDEPDSNITVYILEPEQSLSEYTDLTFSTLGGFGTSYMFESDEDGEFVIRIEYYGNDDIDVMMSIEALEE